MKGGAAADVRTPDRLNPSLGIMARVRVQNGRFAGRQGPVLQRYLELFWGQRGAVFVFDPRDLDAARGTVRGYALAGSGGGGEGRVVSSEFPVPPVVYDQILSRRYENSEAVRKAREALRARCVIYNDGYFDKWEVHRWLQTDARIRPHLPFTALCADRRVFEQSIRRFGTVFIKPVHGSLGRGIVRVRQVDGGVCATLRTKSGNEETLAAMKEREIFRRYRRRWMLRPHIVQEGVELLKWDGRPLDIRVLVQKAPDGRWKRTKSYLRIAGEGEFVSNLTSGGKAVSLSVPPPGMQPRRWEEVRGEIRRLAVRIPPVMERESGRTLAELGIDLGVDAWGRIRVLEVNAKPWKVSETIDGSTKLAQLALTRPVRFGLQLARTLCAGKENLR